MLQWLHHLFYTAIGRILDSVIFPQDVFIQLTYLLRLRRENMYPEACRKSRAINKKVVIQKCPVIADILLN